MPDLVLRAKITAFFQLQSHEPYNDPDQLVVTPPLTQNQRDAQILALCEKIEHDRGELNAAMYLLAPQQKLDRVKHILNSYDPIIKKLLLDEPTHNILILALNKTSSSKELVTFLLDTYKEVDPAHTLLKNAFDCYPEMLQFSLSLLCADTIRLLLDVYKKVGYLEQILLYAQYSVFLQASQAHSEIFKVLVDAYKMIDPSCAQLRNAIAINHAKIFPAFYEQNQNLTHANQAMLIALYQEFTNGLLGGFAIFGWNYAFSRKIRQEVQTVVQSNLLRNSNPAQTVTEDNQAFEAPTNSMHHGN